MSKGGARNRSGPQPDPSSERSERRGYKLTALPATGFDGQVPEFPMPTTSRFIVIAGDGGKGLKVPSEERTDAFRERELEVWAEAWRTPQACAWSMEPWRWPTIAEFCRLKTIVEQEPDANAALVAQLHRFRDQIGLTPAGMRENGWGIAHDEVTPKREQAEPKAKPQRRLRAVDAQ